MDDMSVILSQYFYTLSLFIMKIIIITPHLRDTNQKSASINDKKLEYSITQRKQIMINSDKIINTD